MNRPDPRDYQQLKEPKTGRFDCAGYSAALSAAVDSKGKWKLTGRQVRLNSDEPVPDPWSPGLNLRQTDDALVLLTKGEVNLDTQWEAPWGRVETKLKEGRWGHLCVMRGPLVDAGFAGGDNFRGRHGVVIAYDPDQKTPFLFDPLVPFYQDVTWAALKRAAGLFTPEVGIGQAAIAFTRIVTGTPVPAPRYSVKFTPQSFFVYRVDPLTLKIIDFPGGEPRKAKRFSGPTSAPCTSKRAYDWPGHGGNRELVRVTKGSLFGLYVEPGASGVKLVVTK